LTYVDKIEQDLMYFFSRLDADVRRQTKRVMSWETYWWWHVEFGQEECQYENGESSQHESSCEWTVGICQLLSKQRKCSQVV